MRVEEILEEFEEMVKDAWTLPLSGGKGFVNIEKIGDLINEIRAELPNELTQAKAIISDRSQIINDAKNESERIISLAEEKAKVMVNRDEIVKQATEKAESLILEAKVQSRDMKKAAHEYVDDMMKRTDDVLTETVADLRKTRQNFKNTQQ